MATSIEINGKDVKNPVIKFLVIAAVCIFIVFLFSILGSIVFTILGWAALLLILSAPIHFILRFFGRRGFFVRKGNTTTWTITGAFKRR